MPAFPLLVGGGACALASRRPFVDDALGTPASVCLLGMLLAFVCVGSSFGIADVADAHVSVVAATFCVLGWADVVGRSVAGWFVAIVDDVIVSGGFGADTVVLTIGG